jgi:hypothetical protein
MGLDEHVHLDANQSNVTLMMHKHMFELIQLLPLLLLHHQQQWPIVQRSERAERSLIQVSSKCRQTPACEHEPMHQTHLLHQLKHHTRNQLVLPPPLLYLSMRLTLADSLFWLQQPPPPQRFPQLLHTCSVVHT